MQTRRTTLAQGLASAAVLGGGASLGTAAHAFNKAAFDARTVEAAVKALGGNSLSENRNVSLQAPEIAENGAAVPMGLGTTLPNVRRLALLIEKNPNALTAMFEVNDAVEANFNIRVKMGQSSNVYAVAIDRDGRGWFTRRDVKVTLGGCG